LGALMTAECDRDWSGHQKDAAAVRRLSLAMARLALLREHMQEAAHEVRYLGNDMAHGDFVTIVAEQEADETLGLMAEVLAEVFQSQARIQRRGDARLGTDQPS
jgi:hypothetical protein